MTEELTELSPSFKDEVQRELQRLRATPTGQRITALETLLGGDNVVLLAPAPVAAAAPEPTRGGRPGTGVSEPKLRAVRKYMASKGEARQVDLTNDLGENSGSISLALRALAAQGLVEDTGRVDRKAKVWRWIGPPEDDGGTRATVIEPGAGVRSGRRVS